MIAHNGKNYAFWTDLVRELEEERDRYKTALQWIGEKCQGTPTECACSVANKALQKTSVVRKDGE